VGRFIDVGQEANGFIAIGQMATGFIAVGQVATGVIAVGQVARGFIVVGQGGFGLISLGMASVGLIYSVGVLGAGGRGRGGIVPLVPRLSEPTELPARVSFDAIERGAVAEGWVEVRLVARPDATVRLEVGGEPLPVRLDARLRRAVPKHSGRTLLGFIRRGPAGLVCERLMEVPEARLHKWQWWFIWASQLALLFCGTVAFWYMVVRPIFEVLARLVV
jgi:hypothetical protein